MNRLKSEWRDSTPFMNAKGRMKVSRLISPIFNPKFAAIATTFSNRPIAAQSEKEGQSVIYDQIPTIW